MASSGGDAIPLQEIKWKALFDECDTDKDGTINYHELNNFINSSRGKEIPSHVVQIVHRRADRNGDGTIDFNEFVHMIHHPENQLLFGHYMETIGKASKNYIKLLVPRSHRVHKFDTDATDVPGQYEDEYTCCPPPFGMVAISIIEIILFIVDESQGDTRYGDGPVARMMILDPYKRKEAWRFLSYMFVHIGYMHLIINLAVQLMLGVPLEMVHRWWRVLLIYFAGVIAGSLGTTVFDPEVKLAGASGGVYALITAHIATIILNWKEMTMPIVQLLIFLVITIIDTATAIYNRYYLDINEHIGYVAHFAGALAGLLVGILILRNLEVNRGEKILKWVSLTVYLLLMGTAIIINVAWTSHFPQSRYVMNNK